MKEENRLGSDMITTGTPKEKVHLSFVDILTLIMVLSGAIGGGFAVIRVLEHFGLDGISSIAATAYWIGYCVLVINQMRSPKDIDNEKRRAYRDGYNAGYLDCKHGNPPTSSAP